MVICASVGCNNSSVNKRSRITFHRFPKNPQMRNLWILAMRRKNWVPTNRSVLCSEHFAAGCFSRNLGCAVLKKKAVPSIFPYSSSSIESKTEDWELTRNLELANAIIFMTQVKNTFRDDPEVYHDFVCILTEYKAKRVRYLRKAKWRICRLFRGHTELILHINSLLPDEWRFETQEQIQSGNVAEDEERKVLDMEKVLSFLGEVKNTFSDEPEVYHSFLHILEEYKTQSIDCMHEVHEHVLSLFGGHPELLDRVNHYLPCDWRLKLEQNSIQHTSTEIKEEPKEEPELENASSSNANQPQVITHTKQEPQDPKLENSSPVDEKELEIYKVFMNLLKELKTQRLNTAEVIERLSRLLDENPDLVDHFTKSFPLRSEN